MARRRSALDRRAAWWHHAARRSVLLRLLVVADLFIGINAAALAWWSQTPPGVNIGAAADGDFAAPSVARPISVAVPSIAVASELVRLRRGSDGALEVPRDYAKAGWWEDGVIPGAAGPAVIVGHVDSERKAAVFHRLRSVRPGDKIIITRIDRSRATFAVDAVNQYTKAEFPTAAVYGPTNGSTLRLITCGGRFDRRRQAYSDNLVVFAHLVANEAARPLTSA